MATASGHKEGQASLSMKGVEALITAEGFNHLHLNVRNLARSIRFYKEAFGLKVGFSAGPELIFMVPEVGEHSLALHLVKPDEPVGMAGGFQHFGFKLSSTITIGRSSRWSRPAGSLSHVGSMAVNSPTRTFPIPTAT
jgi:Glyoxalase/Bleomycin resistance protein/Dioxygenase superfamily